MDKKITIIGEVNSQNIGDQAIFLSLSNFLKRKGFDVVGLNLSFSSEKSKNQPKKENTQIRKTKKAHKYLYSHFTFYTKVVNLLMFILSFRRKYARLKKTVEDSYKVVIGGGQLLQNNNLSFPLDLWLVAVVLNKMNIKYSIVGCGVGVKRWDFLSRQLIGYLLKSNNIEYIYVRDQESIDVLKKVFGVEALFIPDPAVSISEFVNMKKIGKKKIGLGIMSPNTLRRNKNMLEYTTGDFITFWVDSYLKLHKMYPENSITLFTTGDYSDYLFANEVKDVLKMKYSFEVAVVNLPRTVEEFIDTLHDYRFILSMRLHSHIIAYSFGIPSYGIVWEEKVRGFSEYAKNESRFHEGLQLNSILEVIKSTENDPLPDISILVQEIDFKLNTVLK